VIAFRDAMAGRLCKIYARAQDLAMHSTGWVEAGTWQVVNAPRDLRVVSVQPTTGSSPVGGNVTFTTVFDDPDGATDIKVVWLMFNGTADYRNAVCLAYNSGLQKSVILLDSSTKWILEGPPGTGRDLQTDRVLWRISQSSITRVGNRLTVRWVLAFAGGMARRQMNIYVRAVDGEGHDTGWEANGRWGVGAAQFSPVPE
jgi:hypothetical protein